MEGHHLHAHEIALRVVAHGAAGRGHGGLHHIAAVQTHPLTGHGGDEQLLPLQQIGEAAEAAGRKDKAIAAYQAAVKELTSIAPAEAAYYQDRIAKLQ